MENIAELAMPTDQNRITGFERHWLQGQM